MTIAMVEKDKHKALPETGNLDLTPTNDSDNNLTRKVRARGHLSSHLRDRVFNGPLKWSRSHTEVGSVPSRGRGKEALPVALSPPLSPKRGQNPLSYSYNYMSDHSLQSSAKTRSCLASSKLSRSRNESRTDGEWTQKMTLSQLRKFLHSRDGVIPKDSDNTMQNLHKGMTINIQKASESYPNISLTVKEVIGQRSMAPHRVPSRATPMKPRVQDIQPIILPLLSRDNTNILTQQSKQEQDTKTQGILPPKSLGLTQANPQEWTKKWIENNPLGPEENEDYFILAEYCQKDEEQKSPEPTTKTEDSPRSPRRVRFGTDKFISNENPLN